MRAIFALPVSQGGRKAEGADKKTGVSTVRKALVNKLARSASHSARSASHSTTPLQNDKPPRRPRFMNHINQDHDAPLLNHATSSGGWACVARGDTSPIDVLNLVERSKTERQHAENVEEMKRSVKQVMEQLQPANLKLLAVAGIEATRLLWETPRAQRPSPVSSLPEQESRLAERVYEVEVPLLRGLQARGALWPLLRTWGGNGATHGVQSVRLPTRPLQACYRSAIGCRFTWLGLAILLHCAFAVELLVLVLVLLVWTVSFSVGNSLLCFSCVSRGINLCVQRGLQRPRPCWRSQERCPHSLLPSA